MAVLGFNLQANELDLVDDGTPVVGIVSDDLADAPQQAVRFQSKNTIVLRTMSPRSHLALHGGIYKVGQVAQHANEQDNADTAPWWGPTGWLAEYIPLFKAANPGVLVGYPPESPAIFANGGLDTGDTAVLALCDVRLIHIAVTPEGGYYPLPSQIYNPANLPVLITEVEAPPLGDPNHDACMQHLVSAAGQAMADYGAAYAFLWGANLQVADAVQNTDGIDFRGQVAAWNQAHKGDTNMDAQTQQLLDQNAHIGEALYALTKAVDVLASSVTPTVGGLGTAVQTAKTQVNALQPDHFVFN